MKKLIILILLLPSLLFAGEIDFKQKEPGLLALIVGFSGSGGAAFTCSGGTYLSYWTGDYSGDEDKICYNSGAGNKDGTNTGGTFGTSYGDGGSVGWLYEYGGDNVSWTIATEDLASKTTGTMWIKFTVSSTVTVDTPIALILSDTTPASNYIRMMIEGSSPDQMRFYYISGGSSYRVDSTSTITADGSTFNIVGGSWRQDAGNDVSITIGNTWASGTVRQNRNYSVFTGTPEYLKIGNESGQTRDIEIDAIVILSTWEAACPF